MASLDTLFSGMVPGTWLKTDVMLVNKEEPPLLLPRVHPVLAVPQMG